MNTDLNMQRAQIVILCELTQNFKLALQISKRTHRQKIFYEIFYIVIRINIDIEKAVNAKREKKTNFTTIVFEILKKEKMQLMMV